MFTLTLTLAPLGVLCLLIDAAQQARRTIPAPAAGWRDGDVLSRRRSAVDAVRAYGYTSGELFVAADEAREPGSRGDVRLLMDLALAQRVAERLQDEQQRHQAEFRPVRARVLVRGVGP